MNFHKTVWRLRRQSDWCQVLESCYELKCKTAAPDLYPEKAPGAITPCSKRLYRVRNKTSVGSQQQCNDSAINPNVKHDVCPSRWHVGHRTASWRQARLGRESRHEAVPSCEARSLARDKREYLERWITPAEPIILAASNGHFKGQLSTLLPYVDEMAGETRGTWLQESFEV